MFFPTQRHIPRISMTLLLLVTSASAWADSPITKPIDDAFKWLEGGSPLPRSSSAYTTYRIGARFTASSNYSCGKFKFENNAAQAVQRMRDQIQQMPNIAAQAATGLIASAPMYLIKEALPDLYGILTWNLDSAIELFRFDYKTCQQLESDIRNTNDLTAHNPYSDFMRVSVLNRYEWGATSGMSIQQTKEDIDNHPGANGVDFLGHGRGTAAYPIEVLHDIMLVGYNIRVHRGDDILNTGTPPPGENFNAVVRIWPTPGDATTWIQRIAGEYKIVLDEGSAPQTATPQGVRAEIERVTELYQSALTNAAMYRDYSQLDAIEHNVPKNLRVSASTLEGIRKASDGQKALMVESLANGVATSVVANTVQEAIQTLRQGAQAPDVVGSAASSAVQPLVSKTIVQLRDQLTEISLLGRINRDLGSANRPVIDMLTTGEDERNHHQPERPTDRQPVIDGQVPKNKIYPPIP